MWATGENTVRKEIAHFVGRDIHSSNEQLVWTSLGIYFRQTFCRVVCVARVRCIPDLKVRSLVPIWTSQLSSWWMCSTPESIEERTGANHQPMSFGIHCRKIVTYARVSIARHQNEHMNVPHQRTRHWSNLDRRCRVNCNIDALNDRTWIFYSVRQTMLVDG